MTSESEAPVEVIQADREAAASMLETFYGNSERYWARQIREGMRDHEAQAQAFAKHRIATAVQRAGVAATFNVNEDVWVKLTDAGRDWHSAWHRRQYPTLTYRKPDESEDGWSKWQLWMLMREMGGAISMGGVSPFETTIRLAATPTPPEPARPDGAEVERLREALRRIATVDRMGGSRPARLRVAIEIAENALAALTPVSERG